MAPCQVTGPVSAYTAIHKLPCLQGHWIAAIGQLPVMVSGAVGCNQFIVASLTDSPMGQPLSAVSDPSARHRVVALTLEAKETEAPGLVMAFAMFGLPAIAGMLKVLILISVQQQQSLPSLLSHSMQCGATALGPVALALLLQWQQYCRLVKLLPLATLPRQWHCHKFTLGIKIITAMHCI